MTAADPKRHHYVPQFLLSRFTDAAGLVATIDLKSGRTFPQAKANAAAETGFYAVENEDGTTDNRVEHVLSEIESHAAVAIARLCDEDVFPPTDNDRSALAGFAALQYVRTPKVREHMAQIGDALFKASLTTTEGLQSMRQVLIESGDYATPAEIDAELEFWSDPSGYTFDPGSNEHIRMMLDLAARLSDSLFHRRLTYVRFTRQRLATCDNPVLLEGSDRTKYMGVPGRVGILNADKVWLPLAAEVAVCFTDDFGGDGVLEANTAVARWLNWLTANHARRWIFHRPGEEPMKHVPLPAWQETAIDTDTLAILADPALDFVDPLDEPIG